MIREEGGGVLSSRLMILSCPAAMHTRKGGGAQNFLVIAPVTTDPAHVWEAEPFLDYWINSC